MTFSYKDPVILFSDFGLDWINVQSDNPIRFDWWIIQKKDALNVTHLMLKYFLMSKSQKLFVKSVQNRKLHWILLYTYNFCQSEFCGNFTNSFNAYYFIAFRMNVSRFGIVESLVRITNIISNDKSRSMSAFMKVSIAIVAIAFIIVFVTI